LEEVGNMAEVKYAELLDELLEKGFYLSEFKRLVQERFPGENIDLWRFLHRRRKQGWKIEIRKEGNDTFYKAVSKPERWKVRKLKKVDEVEVGGGEGEQRSKVLCGVGMYELENVGGRYKMKVRVGSDSWEVEFEGRKVEDVLKELCRKEVEVKKVEKVGSVERGVFSLYEVI
jgi:hypothetical protein